MARPSLFKHRKFNRLGVLLGSRALAVGCLELIWASAYEAGDPFVGNAEEVEATADWKGKAGELAVALVTCGFLDADDEGQLSVHDLEDHAPDYVLKRWDREARRRAAGKTIRDVRKEAADAMWASKRMQTADTFVQADANGGHLHASVATPAPAPAPKDPDPECVSIRAIQVPPSTATVVAKAIAEITEVPVTTGAKAIGGAVVKLNGQTLLDMFARVRAEVIGGLTWTTPRDTKGSAQTHAEAIREAGAETDVEPTMRAFLLEVKAGTWWNSREFIADPSRAFGEWARAFHRLREQIHGRSPPPPEQKARGSPAKPAQPTDEERRRNAAKPDAEWVAANAATYRPKAGGTK